MNYQSLGGNQMKLDEYFLYFADEEGNYFSEDLRDSYMKFLVEVSKFRGELSEEKRLPLDEYQYVTMSINHIKTKITDELDKFFDPIALLKEFYLDEFDINNLNTFYEYLRRADDEDVVFFQDMFKEGWLDQLDIDGEIINGIFKERELLVEKERFLRKVDQREHLQLVD